MNIHFNPIMSKKFLTIFLNTSFIIFFQLSLRYEKNRVILLIFYLSCYLQHTLFIKFVLALQSYTIFQNHLEMIKSVHCDFLPMIILSFKFAHVKYSKHSLTYFYNRQPVRLLLYFNYIDFSSSCSCPEKM